SPSVITFPYTTLVRSHSLCAIVDRKLVQNIGHMVLDGLRANAQAARDLFVAAATGNTAHNLCLAGAQGLEQFARRLAKEGQILRSEEHTSELQSRENL